MTENVYTMHKVSFHTIGSGSRCKPHDEHLEAHQIERSTDSGQTCVTLQVCVECVDAIGEMHAQEGGGLLWRGRLAGGLGLVRVREHALGAP